MENRLREFRTKPAPGRPKGYTLEDVAEGIGASVKHVSRLELGEAPLTPKWLAKFSGFFGVSDIELVSRGNPTTVPLVGYAGADEMYAWDPVVGPWRSFGAVAVAGAADDMVAVRVRGAWLEPRYRDGEVLFFRRPGQAKPEQCVGQDCMVQIRGGPVLLKRVERGRAGLRLCPCSGAQGPVIEGAEIEWVAPVELRLTPSRGQE